jgi:hypothetical protein
LLAGRLRSRAGRAESGLSNHSADAPCSGPGRAVEGLLLTIGQIRYGYKAPAVACDSSAAPALRG